MYGHGRQGRYRFMHAKSKKLGPVIGGRFGPLSTVTLFDADLIDEYFVKQGNKTGGRLASFNDPTGNALMYVQTFLLPLKCRFNPFRLI